VRGRGPGTVAGVPDSPRPTALGLVLVAVVALLVACGGNDVDTDDCQVVAPVSPGRTEVTVTAKSMAFDVECLQVEPGTLVVTFVNEDSGVPHNFHVKDEGSTDLTNGPDEQVLTLELPDAGTYDFVCDPHPNMKGAIVVA
jgi:plastocyanin